MCQYRLVEHFSDFLRTDPLLMAQAVIQGLNLFIGDIHVDRYCQEGEILDDLIETFNFRGKPAFFVQDKSYVWDAGGYTDKPIEMAAMLFEFISELASSKDSRLDSILDVFRDEVWVAFFWKRLLKTASQFPEVFAPHLFELCIAELIQMHLETSYELGLFLEAAASEFTSEQLRQIEESIVELPRKTKDKDNRSSLDLTRNRLLAQIPMNLLSNR